jgi:hypothetical protein
MLDQGCGLEASPRWVRRQFLADTRASKVKGNTGTITKRCFFFWLMKFLSVPDTNILTLNIQGKKIKINGNKIEVA